MRSFLALFILFPHQNFRSAMDYYSDIWTGYLTGIVLNRCLKLSIQRCPGCISKLKSPVLHQHQQHSLLDKVKLYYNEVRGLILPSLDKLYDIIAKQLPHSADPAIDKQIYCQNGVFFLTSSNPDSLYWGRYIDEFNDATIDSMLNIFLKKNSK